MLEKKKSKKVVSIFKWHDEPFNSEKFLCELECDKCGLNLSDIVFGNLIFIDTNDRDMMFNEIPEAILIGDRVCILYSIIQTVDANHFIAHIKRCNQAWYTFDSKKQKMSLAKFGSKSMAVHSLVYTCVSSISAINVKQNPKSFEVIQNFHSFMLNGTKVNVNKVCGPDASLHILCNIFSDNPNIFEKNCQQTTLYALMKAFNSIDENAVYYHRAILLLKKKFACTVQSFTEITIDCDCNIYNAIQMLLSDILPSSKTIKICACGTTEFTVSVLEIDFKLIVEQGITSLSSCILFRNKKEDSTCSKCEEQMEVTHILSNIVFIDIQPITSLDGKMALPKMELKSLPIKIMIAEKQYSLKGVIEFQLNENGLSHYVAHCFENGQWIAFDDLLKKQKKSTLSRIEPHILVYTI